MLAMNLTMPCRLFGRSGSRKTWKEKRMSRALNGVPSCQKAGRSFQVVSIDPSSKTFQVPPSIEGNSRRRRGCADPSAVFAASGWCTTGITFSPSPPPPPSVTAFHRFRRSSSRPSVATFGAAVATVPWPVADCPWDDGGGPAQALVTNTSSSAANGIRTIVLSPGSTAAGDP